MPRAFLLKRKLVENHYFDEQELALVFRQAVPEDKTDNGSFAEPTRRRRNKPVKAGSEVFQEITKPPKRSTFSYPADVKIDRSVNNAGNRVYIESDFINNEKNSSASGFSLGFAASFGGNGKLDFSARADSKSPLDRGDKNYLHNEVDGEGGKKSLADSKCLQEHKANEPSHKASKLRQDKGIHRCNQCGKIFKTKYTLSIHLKMPDHTKSRPFVCNICGKGFRLSSTLCRHKIIHTEKKPHKCNTCGKCFNRSSTLKTHLRTHSQEKTFVCDVCHKGFHQKGNLRNHIMIHTGEKPFQCSRCERAFNKMSNLKFHMHTHSEEARCPKKFDKKADLTKHAEEEDDE